MTSETRPVTGPDVVPPTQPVLDKLERLLTRIEADKVADIHALILDAMAKQFPGDEAGCLRFLNDLAYILEMPALDFQFAEAFCWSYQYGEDFVGVARLLKRAEKSGTGAGKAGGGWLKRLFFKTQPKENA